MANTQWDSEFEANRQRFLELIEAFRPKLHRYCSRMVGSALDGEDLVQETLAQAYYRLSQLKQDRPLEPWLFRIAHNKCIDFLRKNKISTAPLEDFEEPSHSDSEEKQEVEQALLVLVTHLPPMERACMVLKEVMDYALAEIAEIVESTPGAVKSALHRGRDKLKLLKRGTSTKKPLQGQHTELLSQYVYFFNQRDWTGLRELIEQDVRLEVVGWAESTGRSFVESNYFGNYSRLEVPWQFTSGFVDGESLLICWRLLEGKWVAQTALRLEIVGEKVVGLQDYIHVEYLLEHADIVSPSPKV